MDSSDIYSSFTNETEFFSCKKATDLSVENVFQDRTRVDDLSKEAFRKLLTGTMSESLILLNQEFYTRHDGVAIVFLLRSTFANAFFVILKIFGIMNLNLLSIEGKLVMHSYFFAENITSNKTKNKPIPNSFAGLCIKTYLDKVYIKK